jgi:hypothetical protein
VILEGRSANTESGMTTATVTVTDLEAKKTFLQQGSALYAEMIRLAPNDVIRRYLAFRIVVNAMAFEDIVQDRKEPRMRKIRDALLAHKQEADFFVGHSAAGEITDATIAPLLARMSAETTSPDPRLLLPELSGGASSHNLGVLAAQVFDKYTEDYLSGYRIINNYLCVTGNAIHEITKGELPGAFYRYHSSKALYDLSEYLFNNCLSNSVLPGLAMHAKLDMLLHAQNMVDSVIRDTRNPHSIDGLLEVMVSEGIGDPSPLQALKSDATFNATYRRVRHVRNKLIGHMDGRESMEDLIKKLDALQTSDHCDLVNMIDQPVFLAAKSDMAIWARYTTGNQKLTDPRIVGLAGPPPPPYY